jgi:hypothetical protein
LAEPSATERIRAAAFLTVFAFVLILLVVAVIFRVWFGVLAGAGLAIGVLPAAWRHAGILLRGTRAEVKLPAISLRVSRAWQMALVGLLLLLPLVIWRITDDGRSALVIGGAAIAGYIVWFVRVLQREGWSGDLRGR